MPDLLTEKQQQFNNAMEKYEKMPVYVWVGHTTSFINVGCQVFLGWMVIKQPVGPFLQILTFAASYILADFVNGLVHMYMDYKPCKPGTGLKDLYFWEGPRDSAEFHARQAQVYARISGFERIVYDFKKHHPFPDLLGRHSFLHLMKGPTFLLALPLSLVLNVVFLALQPPAWLLVGTVVFLLGSSMTQALHGALHRDDVGLALCLMRRTGLVMSRRAHQLHHDTLTQDFAVINGWANPLVNLCVHTLLHTGIIRSDGLEPT